METEASRRTRASHERRTFVFGAMAVLLAMVCFAHIHVGSIDRSYGPEEISGIQVDVNAADSDTLALLDQIGPERARRIVSHREAHGPFRNYPDLMSVPGIGRKTVEGLVGRVRFGSTIGPGEADGETDGSAVMVVAPVSK